MGDIGTFTIRPNGQQEQDLSVRHSVASVGIEDIVAPATAERIVLVERPVPGSYAGERQARQGDYGLFRVGPASELDVIEP